VALIARRSFRHVNGPYSYNFKRADTSVEADNRVLYLLSLLLKSAMSVERLSTEDKLVRKLRKKLRQIEHLETSGRSLNEEESIKVNP
jgi:hypothetical protein